MSDLIADFLSEASEHLDLIDCELVRFEQNPNDREIVRNIFRLVHTIKGTCGFFDLPRLEALAHAAETLMERFLDGRLATTESVSLVLRTLDRLKSIMGALDAEGGEPAGSDADLIDALIAMAVEPEVSDAPSSPAAPQSDLGSLGRPLAAGEVSLEELERVFRDAPGPRDATSDSASRDPGASGDEEEPVEAARNGGLAKSQTIRVNVDTLELLMTMVSELVLTRNQLLEIGRRSEDTAYKAAMQRLSFVTAELQEGVMKTRMQPIGTVCQKLPRLVRDLSEELGKPLELVVVGAETELDRQLLESIKDPLVHMVRNSADHGLETLAERRMAGKPDRGTIRITASHEGGTVNIEIADDGRGLDISAIRRKAADCGVASPAELDLMSDAQIAKLIFHPGLSTAKAVTSISGRGVGMDVVKTNVEAIGGLIEIANRPGQGAAFTIKIPLTLAIIAALIVEADGQRFAVPQGAVRELVAVDPEGPSRLERLNGACFLRLRDQMLPVFGLPQALGSRAEEQSIGFVMVMRVGRTRFGLLVDFVRHTEEIVVKPMSTTLAHVEAYAGNTILGDGSVALILDPTGLSRMTLTEQERQPLADLKAEAGKHEDPLGSLLIFRSSDGLKAVPLSLVTRLENIAANSIEYAGGNPVLQYRGAMLPLTMLDTHEPLPTEGDCPIVIFSHDGVAMGLIIGEIVDIVDEALKFDMASDTPGLIGSAVLRGCATDVIDLAYYLNRTATVAPAAPKAPRHVLMVGGSPFAHNMLRPMLAAAGFEIQSVVAVEEAAAAIRDDQRFGAILYDFGARGDAGGTVDALRAAEPRSAKLPAIALCDAVTDALTDQARYQGLGRLVSKFDARGVVDALREIDATAAAA